MFKKITLVILFFIVIFGFYLRLSGISQNHSFWADEAYISSISRDIVTGEIGIIEGMTAPGGRYQPLQVAIVALSMKLAGVGEYGARLPSVIFGTLAIILIFLIAKYFSDSTGGLLAAFLASISTLGIVHATQTKPYIAIQFFVLLLVWLLIKSKNIDKKFTKYIHASIILTLIIIAMLHIIGILALAIYFTYFSIIHYKKMLGQSIIVKAVVIVLAIFSAVLFFIYLKALNVIEFNFLPYNNITYLRELLWKNYGFIFLPSLFGFMLSFRKNFTLLVSVLAWIGVLLFFWTFQHYSKNIRYLVPLFGIIFIFFGVFWSKAGEKLFEKKSWLICLIVAGMLFVGGNKIVRKPQSYYSPNLDLVGDVQFANYKEMYSQIKQKYPNYQDLYFVNDIFDSERWYFDRYSDAYFMKGVTIPYEHGIVHNTIYGSLNDFKKIMENNPQGLLIIEDWESILPEDIKAYAKENLKLEFRVESLEVAPSDPWPLAVYSWGMEEEKI